MDFEVKEKYDINDLVKIVGILRSPDGCPWDKVQTHESIRKDFIEEVYEAVEAIDEKESEHMREELGDVLLQVVFHSVLETEKGSFEFSDVVDDICKKMVLRHPHVFGEVTADTTDEVLRNWDQIKMQTHSQQTVTEAMESVSKTLPSLMRAQKLHKKAARGGVVPAGTEEALDRISEKLSALREAVKSGKSGEGINNELGELLFSAAGLSVLTDTDCERSLYDTCDSFIASFGAYEKEAAARGIDIQDSDTEVTNQLWYSLSK